MGVKLQSFSDRASCVEASQQYLSSPCEVEIKKSDQRVIRFQKLFFPRHPAGLSLRKIIGCFTDLELSINTLGFVRLELKLPMQRIAIIHRQKLGCSKQQYLFHAVVKTDHVRVKNLSPYNLQTNGTTIERNETKQLQLDDVPLVTLTENSQKVFLKMNGYLLKDAFPEQSKRSLSSLIQHANSIRSSTIRIFESEEALQRELQDLNCKVVVEECVRTHMTCQAREFILDALIPQQSSKEITICAEPIHREGDGKNPPEMNFSIASVLEGRSVRLIHQVPRLPMKIYTHEELLFQGIYPSEQVRISNQIGYPLLIQQSELLSGDAREFAYTPLFSICSSPDLQNRISATWHRVTRNLEDLPCKDYRAQDVFMIQFEKESHLLKKSTIKVVLYFLKHGEDLIECRQSKIKFMGGENVNCKLGQSPLFCLEKKGKSWASRRRFLEKGLTINGKELFTPNKIEQEAPDSPREEYAEVIMEDDEELFSPRIDLLQDASSAQQESHSHTDRLEDDDQKSE